ncbi:MAG: hypothetical protein HOW73_03585 [Polyangiaceae bacterium]|nr:hypothetical protein [Polyangiaceae bacterium]
MTLPRKYTRPLTVDGIDYRWMLKETDYGALFELLLVVEAVATPNGEQLVAHIEWRDRGLGDAVTPGVVASVIRDARQRGWEPDRRGSCPPCSDTFLQLVRARRGAASHNTHRRAAGGNHRARQG